jgi:DNA-binding response OmpR family regulator
MSVVRRSDELASICVCSPNEPFLEKVSDYLGAVGLGPLPAANGSAAVRLCRYVRVEVLVLDLAFSNGTALDVLKKIFEPDFPEVGGVLVLTRREGVRQ